MSLAPIAETQRATLVSIRGERARSYPLRLCRLLSRRIDQACERVERVNRDGGGPCPESVRTLIGYLQLQAGEPVNRPYGSAEAHSELFRLSSVLLGRPVEVEEEVDR
jgi:hypothetical protein